MTGAAFHAKACSEASLVLEGSAHPELSILFQMAATEIERLARFETAMRDANDKLRSAYAIADRAGADTNWPAIKKQIEAALLVQSLMIYGTSHLPAAVCTPKTFRLPPAAEEIG